MKRSAIAAQLYTVRDFCRTENDFAASLSRLRAIGYRAVQVSGVGPIPTKNLAEILRSEGMFACATHEPARMILDRPGEVVERLATLGCRLTAYPWPEGVDLSDPAQVDALIRDLGAAGSELGRAGLRLGYHNHAIEFLPYRDGKTVLEQIFEATDPAHLVAELDTYWIQYGGGSCVGWCRRLASRLPFIHLKDYRMTPANVPEFAELGRGNLGIAEIVREAEAAGCEWFIVEQDTCRGDPFDSLRISYEFLSGIATQP